MTHSVKSQIEEMAKLSSKSIDDIIADSKAEIKDLGDDIIVWNRRDENTVNYELKQLKEKIKKEKIEKERFAGYRWVKDGGNWAVAGNFEDKKIGDTITVIKASGQKQEKEITSFTNSGNALVK